MAGPRKTQGHPFIENCMTYGSDDVAQDFDMIQIMHVRNHKLLQDAAAPPPPPPPPPPEKKAIPDSYLPTDADRRLMQAYLAAITPASREAITFWGRFSGPKNPLAADVAAALCRNQSRPALALFESMLTDRAQPRERKLGWMRQLIPGHRTDAHLLKFCETLLQSGKLEPELQIALVEAIFDYRPETWDPGDGAPAAATWSSASRQARNILKNIATYALNTLSLDSRQKKAVRDGLKSLP